MKTFVFDLDGVVCVGPNFSVALEREFQISRQRLAPFFRTVFPACIVGLRDLKEAVSPYLAEWGWRGSVEELLAFWFQQEHVLDPQILECVRTLRARGHRCALGTNQESYRSDYLRQEMRLAQEFDHIFTSCEIGAAKPSPQFFQTIEIRLGEAPSALCLIDDAESNIAGAHSRGWTTILYSNSNDIHRIHETAAEPSSLAHPSSSLP